MADDLAALAPMRKPNAAHPLLGVTMLAVEDSLFACEALRLMCLRSGARLRRADCLASARRHLAVFRPTVVIVDPGLPDGDGMDLISELDVAEPRVPVILASSGDPEAEREAMTRGAQGFMAKPLTDLAQFQERILSFLPTQLRLKGPRQVPREQVVPDPIALRDDLDHVRILLDQTPDLAMRRYLGQFLGSLASCTGDTNLRRAARDLDADTGDTSSALGKVTTLVNRCRDQAAASSDPI